jgi:hypothetical protein
LIGVLSLFVSGGDAANASEITQTARMLTLKRAVITINRFMFLSPYLNGILAKFLMKVPPA